MWKLKCPCYIGEWVTLEKLLRFSPRLRFSVMIFALKSQAFYLNEFLLLFLIQVADLVDEETLLPVTVCVLQSCSCVTCRSASWVQPHCSFTKCLRTSAPDNCGELLNPGGRGWKDGHSIALCHGVSSEGYREGVFTPTPTPTHTNTHTLSHTLSVCGIIKGKMQYLMIY